MRYTAFFLLGVLLIVAQGETYMILGPIAAKGFRPSLLVPLLVYLGVTEANLALGACVAFVLGYVLDVVSGSPIGLHTFTAVATVALARIAGLRIVTQGGFARALLAGAFAALGAIIILVLLVIFGTTLRNVMVGPVPLNSVAVGRPYLPRALLKLVVPHAIATAVLAPLVYRLAEKTSALASSFLGQKPDETRPSKLATPAAARPNEEPKS